MSKPPGFCPAGFADEAFAAIAIVRVTVSVRKTVDHRHHNTKETTQTAGGRSQHSLNVQPV